MDLFRKALDQEIGVCGVHCYCCSEFLAESAKSCGELSGEGSGSETIRKCLRTTCRNKRRSTMRKNMKLDVNINNEAQPKPDLYRCPQCRKVFLIKECDQIDEGDCTIHACPKCGSADGEYKMSVKRAREWTGWHKIKDLAANPPAETEKKNGIQQNPPKVYKLSTPLFVRRRHPYDGTAKAGEPYGPTLIVVGITDHVAANGTVEKACVYHLADGTWEFQWNLSRLYNCRQRRQTKKKTEKNGRGIDEMPPVRTS